MSSINLLKSSLDATMLRYNVLSSNIANADTVGYKRKDIKFEDALATEIEKHGLDGVKNVTPEVYTDTTRVSYRADGNNVDIDVETAELAKTKLKYDTLITRTNSSLSRYKNILQNLK